MKKEVMGMDLPKEIFDRSKVLRNDVLAWESEEESEDDDGSHTCASICCVRDLDDCEEIPENYIFCEAYYHITNKTKARK